MKKITLLKLKKYITGRNIIIGILELICFLSFLVFGYLLIWKFFEIPVIFKYPGDLMKILAIIFYVITFLFIVLFANFHKDDKEDPYGYIVMTNLLFPPAFFLSLGVLYLIFSGLWWIITEFMRCIELV